MGIHNVVIRPQNWDELKRGVKTDKTDALALVQRLDRYVQGNQKALAVIRVPTPEQELARSQSRQREQLLSHRLRFEAQGRSLLLFNGLRIKGPWWKESLWEEVIQQAPPAILKLLQVLRNLLLAVQEQLKLATARLEQNATPQPFGVGALTSQVLEREILTWNRFKNRRQVASLTGMCPGVWPQATAAKLVLSQNTVTGDYARLWWNWPGAVCVSSRTISRSNTGGRCWPVPKLPKRPRRRPLWRLVDIWPSIYGV